MQAAAKRKNGASGPGGLNSSREAMGSIVPNASGRPLRPPQVLEAPS